MFLQDKFQLSTFQYVKDRSDPYGQNITFSHSYLPYLAEFGATVSYRAAGS